jgi:hypothetical protein
VQSAQVSVKSSPEITSRRGKEVRLMQFLQASVKFVPKLTSRTGKEVRPSQ